jgi:hypothetical protein
LATLAEMLPVAADQSLTLAAQLGAVNAVC